MIKEKISTKSAETFPPSMEYKGGGYILHKENKDGTAFYLSSKKMTALSKGEPSAIQVDGKGKVIWEDIGNEE